MNQKADNKIIYETCIDLKKTFLRMDDELSKAEVKGDSVKIIYTTRMTLLELFEDLAVLKNDEESPYGNNEE